LTEKGEYVIFTLVVKSLKANKRLSEEEFWGLNQTRLRRSHTRKDGIYNDRYRR